MVMQEQCVSKHIALIPVRNIVEETLSLPQVYSSHNKTVDFQTALLKTP